MVDDHRASTRAQQKTYGPFWFVTKIIGCQMIMQIEQKFDNNPGKPVVSTVYAKKLL